MSLFRKTESRDAAGWEALRTFATGGGPLLGSGTKNALRLIPLYAATSLIADQFSLLPMTGYDTVNGRKTRLDPQPLLCTDPHVNPVFTRVEWLHQYAVSRLLRGNAYGVVTAIDQFGTPTKIAWLNPDNVRVDESGPVPQYFHNEELLDINTVLHIPWYPAPGSIVGLSPVSHFRSQIETGMAANDYGNKWFRNGATPSGHLKYTGKVNGGTLSNAQSAQVKERFKATIAGNDFFVSGSDWDWKALSVSAEDAQFLQTIKATANQIAAIFHVDPEDIGGEAGSSMTYSTLELNQIKFQVRAQQPLMTALEAHVKRILPGTQYVKLNADAMIRTESKVRAEVHEINLRTGMETQDEGRALEDKAPHTPAEREQWLQYRTIGPADGPEEKAKRIAEIVQKIYLGVGVVVTEEEAREIIRMTGLDLPANVQVKQAPVTPAPTEGGA